MAHAHTLQTVFHAAAYASGGIIPVLVVGQDIDEVQLVALGRRTWCQNAPYFAA